VRLINRIYCLLGLLFLLNCPLIHAFINGTDATADDLRPGGVANPVVALHLKTADGLVHLCSGTLIRASVVLTAGHCLTIVTKVADVSVASQVLDIKSHPDTFVTAKNFVVYPDYINDEDGPDDLGLVLLPIAQSEVIPADLAKESDLKKYSRLIGVGYGEPDAQSGTDGHEKKSGVLRYKRFDNFGWAKSPAGMIYISDKTGIFASGDSGGPLLSNADSGSVTKLTVVAVNIAGGATEGVSVDVAKYKDWIRQTADLLQSQNQTNRVVNESR
jgi:V8-like Glu-specific endopeptidase